MTPTTDAARQARLLLAQGLDRANAAALADIRSECVRVHLQAQPYPGEWRDTRPMLDPREHTPIQVDMAAATLQWACDVGLVHRHPLHTHLVCIPFSPTNPSPETPA